MLSSAIAFFGGFTFFAASLLAVADDNAKRVPGLFYRCQSGPDHCLLRDKYASGGGCGGASDHVPRGFKALLFMGVVLSSINWLPQYREYGRAGGEDAGMTLLMAIGAFSMFLPPFGDAVSKWAAMEASIREPLLIVLLIAASTLTALFWTKWLGRMLATLPGGRRKW
jgi:ech hydrogenase subunit A